MRWITVSIKDGKDQTTLYRVRSRAKTSRGLTNVLRKLMNSHDGRHGFAEFEDETSQPRRMQARSIRGYTSLHRTEV